MAELSTAEALLEELRAASQEAGQRDLEEVREFAKLQVCMTLVPSIWDVCTTSVHKAPRKSIERPHALAPSLGLQ